MKKFCYVNGKFASLEKPQIKLNDLGLLRGYTVFDFMKVTKGKPLFVLDHIKRFRNSAKRLGLRLAKSNDEIEQIIRVLIKKNKMKEGSIRLVLTGGVSTDGITLEGKANFAVFVEPPHYLPKEVFTKGGKLITVDYLRIFPEAKTTNYLLAVSLQKYKNKVGATEILYTANGKIFEATTSSFFVVTNKKIITPKAEVLPGVTRSKVISLAKRAGYEVEEREVSMSDLAKAEEAFITATNKEVAPVVRVNSRTVGNGKPGPITLDLLNRYRILVDSQK